MTIQKYTYTFTVCVKYIIRLGFGLYTASNELRLITVIYTIMIIIFTQYYAGQYLITDTC